MGGLFSSPPAGRGNRPPIWPWDGQLSAHELGVTLAEGPRFEPGASLVTEFDVERIAQDRLRILHLPRWH